MCFLYPVMKIVGRPTINSGALKQVFYNRIAQAVSAEPSPRPKKFLDPGYASASGIFLRHAVGLPNAASRNGSLFTDADKVGRACREVTR